MEFCEINSIILLYINILYNYIKFIYEKIINRCTALAAASPQRIVNKI